MARSAGLIGSQDHRPGRKGAIAMETMFLITLLVISGIVGAVSHYVKKVV
jgi:hypothetical protein